MNEGSPKVPTHPELLGVSEVRSGPEKHSDVTMATQQSQSWRPDGGQSAPARFELSSGERSWEEWGVGRGPMRCRGGAWTPILTPGLGVCACLSGSFQELAVHLAGMNNALKEH